MDLANIYIGFESGDVVAKSRAGAFRDRCECGFRNMRRAQVCGRVCISIRDGRT
jgi:hypothetical protein